MAQSQRAWTRECSGCTHCGREALHRLIQEDPICAIRRRGDGPGFRHKTDKLRMANYCVKFVKRPGTNSPPNEDCFHYEECADVSLAEGEAGFAIVRTLDLSVDPALRCRMNPSSGVEYMSAWAEGAVAEGLGGVGVVEAAGASSAFAVGDLVSANFWPWQLRWKAKEDHLNKISPLLGPGQHPRVIMSCLGLIGLTALLGMEVRGGLGDKADQTATLVVSAAAGACGTLAGQIGRIQGAKRVVGICGSEDKCNVLTGEMGFDAAVNYKSADFAILLAKACPDGVDSYFDNVGGSVSDVVVSLMNRDSHVVLCGQISQYNKDVPYPPPIPPQTEATLKERNISRERFLVLSYPEKFPASLAKLGGWLATGKLKVRETVREGLQETGNAFVQMMAGANVGKMIVHVSDA